MGEGNIFSLSVSSHLDGRGGGIPCPVNGEEGSPSQVQDGGGVTPITGPGWGVPPISDPGQGGAPIPGLDGWGYPILGQVGGRGVPHPANRGIHHPTFLLIGGGIPGWGTPHQGLDGVPSTDIHRYPHIQDWMEYPSPPSGDRSA